MLEFLNSLKCFFGWHVPTVKYSHAQAAHGGKVKYRVIVCKRCDRRLDA